MEIFDHKSHKGLNKLLLLNVALFISCLITAAQSINPDPGKVFDDSSLPRIDIITEAKFVEALFRDVVQNKEYPAIFKIGLAEGVEMVDSVGFRIRGNTSRFSGKKSFKISFNTFLPGNKFHGLEKMNLNGEHNDPSIIRSKLSWDICREMGIPAPRANHVKLYINDNYYGVYINVEHIDEVFVNKRFGNNEGNLYKCLWPAPMKFMGNDPELYKYEVNGRRAYNLKTNIASDNYKDLSHLIDILNNSTVSDLPCELEKVLNVNSLIKAIAVEVFIANWDGPFYNQNNFYLYKNTKTGLFEYIPYDLDNTFGIDWFGVDWANRDIYNWLPDNEERPLYSVIMNVPEYRKQYSFYMKELIENIVDPDKIITEIIRIKDMIAEAVSYDTFHGLDYGWTYNDFIRSYHAELDTDHVPYGLIQYITSRINSVNTMIGSIDVIPIITEISYPSILIGQPIPVSARIVDENQAFLNNNVFYRINNSEWNKLEMLKTAGESNIYQTEISPFFLAGLLEYYISSEDGNGNVGIKPECGYFNTEILPYSSTILKINEIMASNRNFIVDEYGQFNDWIEVYNPGETAVSFNDVFISDDPAEPDKYELSGNSIIEPGEFELFWADGQDYQGDNHLPFRLKKTGEFIGLFQKSDKDYYLIDGFSFFDFNSDRSLSRTIDGAGEFAVNEVITPGYSNTDHRKAVVLFRINMFFQNEIGNFDPEIDNVDITGNFNDWHGSEPNNNPDNNMLYSFALINIEPEVMLDYKFRINQDWMNSEFMADNKSRTYITKEGWQVVDHWYNDENISNRSDLTFQKDKKIIVYPQPATDHLFIKSNKEVEQVIIYTLNGRIVYSKKLAAYNEQKHNISSIGNGLYLIFIRFTDNSFTSQKIIIQ